MVKFIYYQPERAERALSLSREIFERYCSQIGAGSVDEIFENLEDTQKEKFLKISFFYYYRGWKHIHHNNCDVDEGIVLIVLVSVIESIMLGKKYEPITQWYKKNKSSFASCEEALDHYNEKFGIKNIFKQFFNKYIWSIDRQTLLNSIEKLNKGTRDFKPTERLEKISSLIYDLRSSFVHNAEYIPFLTNSDVSIGTFKGKVYSFAIKFPELVKILERGILNYFQLNRSK